MAAANSAVDPEVFSRSLHLDNPLADTEGLTRGVGSWSGVTPVVRFAFSCILDELVYLRSLVSDPKFEHPIPRAVEAASEVMVPLVHDAQQQQQSHTQPTSRSLDDALGAKSGSVQLLTLQNQLDELRAMVASQHETLLMGGIRTLAATDSARATFAPLKMELDEIRIELAQLKQSKADVSVCRDRFSEFNLQIKQDRMEGQTKLREAQQLLEGRVRDSITKLEGEVRKNAENIAALEKNVDSKHEASKREFVTAVDTQKRDIRAYLESKLTQVQKRDKEAISGLNTRLTEIREQIARETTTRTEQFTELIDLVKRKANTADMDTALQLKASFMDLERLHDSIRRGSVSDDPVLRESLRARQEGETLVTQMGNVRSLFNNPPPRAMQNGAHATQNGHGMDNFGSASTTARIPAFERHSFTTQPILAVTPTQAGSVSSFAVSEAISANDPRAKSFPSILTAFLTMLSRIQQPGHLSRDLIRVAFLPEASGPGDTAQLLVDMTDEIIDQTSQSFAQTPRRPDGSMTAQTLESVMSSWGLQPSSFELDSVMKFVKPNPITPIQFLEFMDFYSLFYFYTRVRAIWLQCEAQGLLGDPLQLSTLLSKLGLFANSEQTKQTLAAHQAQTALETFMNVLSWTIKVTINHMQQHS